MLRVLTALFVCTVMQAATINTTLTVNATATIGAAGVTATGTATLTNGIGNGTFTGTISISTFSGPYTITIGSSTITGVITVSPAILAGSGTASATVTGGTGTYANATGSFPTLTGAGSVGATGAITLNFSGPGTVTTGGGGGGPAAPTITGVLNNYSYTPPGFSNSGIAQGSIFIIKGTGMADPTAQAVLQRSDGAGIPLTLNGASVTVVSGGTTVHPGLYYAIAGQLAAVLPANTPVGTATATVTYNNQTSNAFSFQVVSAALGIGTYNGLAIATNATDYSLYSYTNSAKPGDILVLWGSGLGAIPQDSDTVYTTSPHALATKPQFFIGGLPANVLYAGHSGYPGLDQIDVTVPTNVTPGCNVSIVALSGSGANLIPSNVTAVAVDPSGKGCSDSLLNFNGNSFTTLSGLATVKTGFVGLLHEVSPGSTTDAAIATFQKTTGASIGGGAPSSVGSCSVTQQLTSGATTTTVGLDAGTISVTGPTGSATLQSFPTIAGTSFAQLAAGFIPTTGGTFTFNGGGGADVGKFNTTVTFPNPLLNWTNQTADATVSRASGIDVNWTGGAAGTLVIISGSASNATSGVTGSFTCYAPVAAGTFHVPSPIALIVPAGSGSLSVENATAFNSFTASGIDFGYAFGGSYTSINVTYQ